MGSEIKIQHCIHFIQVTFETNIILFVWFDKSLDKSICFLSKLIYKCIFYHQNMLSISCAGIIPVYPSVSSSIISHEMWIWSTLCAWNRYQQIKIPTIRKINYFSITSENFKMFLRRKRKFLLYFYSISSYTVLPLLSVCVGANHRMQTNKASID